jgi:hypothetical protein
LLKEECMDYSIILGPFIGSLPWLLLAMLLSGLLKSPCTKGHKPRARATPQAPQRSNSRAAMPELWQRIADPHRELRRKSGATMLGGSMLPKCRTMQNL